MTGITDNKKTTKTKKDEKFNNNYTAIITSIYQL